MQRSSWSRYRRRWNYKTADWACRLATGVSLCCRWNYTTLHALDSKIYISVFLQFSLCMWTTRTSGSVRSQWISYDLVNFVSKIIKDWLTVAGGIYEQLLLVGVPSLFSFVYFLYLWFFLYWMIFGLAAIGSSFDGVIAVLVYTVINNLSSLSLPSSGIMTIYNNLSVQKILVSNYATWQQCYFCDFFLFQLYSEMK